MVRPTLEEYVTRGLERSWGSSQTRTFENKKSRWLFCGPDPPWQTWFLPCIRIPPLTGPTPTKLSPAIVGTILCSNDPKTMALACWKTTQRCQHHWEQNGHYVARDFSSIYPQNSILLFGTPSPANSHVPYSSNVSLPGQFWILGQFLSLVAFWKAENQTNSATVLLSVHASKSEI